MQKEKLFAILSEWNFWSHDLEVGIPRNHYLSQMKDFVASKQILLISGVRRSGKSFLMRQLAKQMIDSGKAKKSEVLIVNFEDPRLLNPSVELLEDIFKIYLEKKNPKKKPYIFLDEVQEVHKWEKWVRMMHELGKARIIVSGSNSKLLSTEFATSLTGRHLDVLVYPLSFSEFLSFQDFSFEDESDLLYKKIDVMRFLETYLEYGGFPEVVLENKRKSELLLHYFKDIMDRDIVKRYRTRKRMALRGLANFYLSNISSHVSFRSLENTFSTTSDTIGKFSEYLEAAYLTFFLKRFSFKVKEQEKSQRKVYCIDTGLANVVGFQFSQNKGKIVENLVFLELLRKQLADFHLELYYWKDVAHKEVDFLLKRGTKVSELIQVCWDVSHPKTRKRETGALFKAMKELNIKEGLIITEDYEEAEKKNGKTIRFFPLWKWLLEDLF